MSTRAKTPADISVDPATGVATFSSLAAEVWRRPARLGAVRLVVVDGPAGSGKTTFAYRAARALGRAPVIHLDDLYEGWQGLPGVGERVDRWILRPLREGFPARYRRYDWHDGRFAEWHLLPVVPALLIEGCGAGQQLIDHCATLRVWVEAPSDIGLTRGLERDGEDMREHWLTWREQEAAHFAAEGTKERADVWVDGAPEVNHDPEQEFVCVRQ